MQKGFPEPLVTNQDEKNEMHPASNFITAKIDLATKK